MRIKADIRLDARGLSRPLPALRAKKALDSMSPGEVLELTATAGGTDEDIEVYTARVGHELLGVSTEGGTTRFLIRKA